ncbi:MAG: 6-carboxytetrahydropterin synthase QueD [Bacteroidetes bacterium]|nr:MAG: 6-carboxytetrahydropterin synthase QueD [Bacteroidota bacterium]
MARLRNIVIRISKAFTFEMAHALDGHDGKCANIHGHSYRLEVTIMGTPLVQQKHPKNGMVMDYTELSAIIYSTVISEMEHVLLLNKDSPFIALAEKAGYKKVVAVPYQPTCEMLLADFMQRIKEELPKHLALCTLRLSETQTSFAEWHASDNLQ